MAPETLCINYLALALKKSKIFAALRADFPPRFARILPTHPALRWRSKISPRCARILQRRFAPHLASCLYDHPHHSQHRLVLRKPTRFLCHLAQLFAEYFLPPIFYRRSFTENLNNSPKISYLAKFPSPAFSRKVKWNRA